MYIGNTKEVMKIAHLSQDAVHMIGNHGIGKTRVVDQFCEENGYHLEVLQLTVMDEGDLIGIPVTTEKNGEVITHWAKPVWLQRVHKANTEGKHCVIFMDELGRASQSIQQAALQMVLEGRIQEHSLGELDGLKSLVVVADNPSEDYDTAEFDKALEDRFITLVVETNVEKWVEYAKSKNLNPAIIDFIIENPDSLHYTPESDDDKGATPRAWEKLSKILENTPKDSPILFNLVQGKVGKAVGTHFYQYFMNYANIFGVSDIKKALKGKSLNTEPAQRKASEKLSDVLTKLETIQQTELVEKLYGAYQKGKIPAEYIVVTVGALPYEVQTSVFSSFKKSEDEDRQKFYLGDFVEAMPNKWLVMDHFKNRKLEE